MERNLQSLNEVIVGSADPGVAKLLTRLKRMGRVVRLAPQIVWRCPDVLVTAMLRLWDFSYWLSSGDFETLKHRLEVSNAFSDDEGMILRFDRQR